MKTTIAEMINPEFQTYATLGMASLVLMRLMATARDYRDSGRWGTTGPSESLCGYGGCVNSARTKWHTARKGATDYRSHVRIIHEAVLSALCSSGPASLRWREAHGVGLESCFVFRAPDAGQIAESKAFAGFLALQGHRLPNSINPAHDDVDVLCEPQLLISGAAVTLKANVTSVGELETSPRCHSAWDVAYLIDQPSPKWRYQRESFAEFVTRGTAFFKAATMRAAALKELEGMK